MKKVKIIFVSNNLNKGAGVAEYIYKLCKCIDKNKFQIDLFLYNYSDTSYINDLRKNYNIEIYCFKKCSCDRFEDILEKNKYDIIELHAPIYSFKYLKIAKKYGIPVRICHAHSIIRSTSKIKNFFSKFLNFNLYKYANTFFSCSELAARYWFKKNEDYYFIPNFINEPSSSTNSFKNEVIKKYNITDNNIVLGYVGRISKEKNVASLIKIINKLNNENNVYKLFLIGNGNEKYITSMKKKINYNNKNNVFFVGYQSNVYDWYSFFDLFVFPSKKEGLGMSLIEAQYGGSMCIAHKSMPKETNLGKIKYLDNDIDMWVEYIKKFNKNSKNLDTCSLIQKYKLFDNNLNILKLEKIYFELLKSEV